MEGNSTFSKYLTLIKELKEFISNGNAGDYDSTKLFEISEHIEKISKQLSENNLNDEMDNQLSSVCDVHLEELESISDELLSSYLIHKIPDNSTRKAISEFISRFGDNRFSTVCRSLAEKREIFLMLSSITESNSSDHIIVSFLLQTWTKALKSNTDENNRNRCIEMFDTMLSSKESFKLISHISKFNDHKAWKSTVQLIYSRIILKLEPFEQNVWSWFASSKDLFHKLIKNNEHIEKLIFDFLLKSGDNAEYQIENSEWINSNNFLNISSIVSILNNLLSLECTFNKTKNFMDEQKNGSNAQFWNYVELEYLESRTKSPSLLINKSLNRKSNSSNT